MKRFADGIRSKSSIPPVANFITWTALTSAGRLTTLGPL